MFKLDMYSIDVYICMSILYGYYFEVDLQVLCTIEIDVYMLCIGNDIACPMMYRH